jgi:hypothetical protein
METVTLIANPDVRVVNTTVSLPLVFNVDGEWRDTKYFDMCNLSKREEALVVRLVKFLTEAVNSPIAKRILDTLHGVTIAATASNAKYCGDYCHKTKMLRLNFSRPFHTVLITLVHEMQHHWDYSVYGPTKSWVELDTVARNTEHQFAFENNLPAEYLQ